MKDDVETENSNGNDNDTKNSDYDARDGDDAETHREKRTRLTDALENASVVKHAGLPDAYKKIAQWVGVIVVGFIVLGMIITSFYHGNSENDNAPTPAALNQMQSAELELQENLAKLKSEEQPSLPAPPMPDAALPASVPTVTTNTDTTESDENYAARQNAPTTMYSADVTGDGGNNPGDGSNGAGGDNGSNGNGSGTNGGTFTGKDTYSQFGNQDNEVSTLSATQIVHPDYTIASGEFMHAVLETAVNSDLPGMVRAEVSTPVYAYVGEKPLIPAGSRLIGQYASSVMQGMTRVFVIWNRVILPNGTSVQINSPGSDNLGMAGMNADSVNTHFFAQFGQAALLSVLGAGAATVGVNPTDENNSASMYRQAISQSFQQSAQQSLNGTVAMKPTLKIFQGADIVVFVAHDVSFYSVLHPNRNNDMDN